MMSPNVLVCTVSLRKFPGVRSTGLIWCSPIASTSGSTVSASQSQVCSTRQVTTPAPPKPLGLVGVLTTFRVPDKDNKGVWSLVCPNVCPAFICPAFLPILRERACSLQFFFPSLVFFFLPDQYR